MMKRPAMLIALVFCAAIVAIASYKAEVPDTVIAKSMPFAKDQERILPEGWKPGAI